MKKVSVKIARPIKVELNTLDVSKNQWMQIKCCITGEILHTGMPEYIKSVASRRYNHKVVQ